jgi:hypothetical protein
MPAGKEIMKFCNDNFVPKNQATEIMKNQKYLQGEEFKIRYLLL